MKKGDWIRPNFRRYPYRCYLVLEVEGDWVRCQREAGSYHVFPVRDVSVVEEAEKNGMPIQPWQMVDAREHVEDALR